MKADQEEMFVPYVDLGAQWKDIREEALDCIDEILSTGKYLEHEFVEMLENEIAEILNVNYVITLNSGTDALLLTLAGLDIKRGDEVLTVPNSFIATAAAISHVGAIPVMVDVGSDHLMDVEKIEAKITKKTKAIMPVHLEGKVCDMERICRIAQDNNLLVIEDSAQSFGSRFNGQASGTFGDAGCFSLHPLKNLNALGDGGFVATNNSELNQYLRSARNHGQTSRNTSTFFGQVSRLDSLQAGILRMKLKTLHKVILKRREIASEYDRVLSNSSFLLPICSPNVYHSYHLYVIEVENRDEVARELLARGIETKIHYPKLITDQEAYINRYGKTFEINLAKLQSEKILSIPVHHHLKKAQVCHVTDALLEIGENLVRNV